MKRLGPAVIVFLVLGLALIIGTPALFLILLAGVAFLAIALASPKARARLTELFGPAAYVLTILFVVASSIWLLVGLLPALARTFPEIHDTLHRWGASAPASRVEVVMKAKDTKFDRERIELTSGGSVYMDFTNFDGDVHNVAIYTDSPQHRPIFRGGLIVGPSTVRYEFKVPPPGSYVFICDPHPDDMKGTLVVTGTEPGDIVLPGSLAGLARRAAESAHESQRLGFIFLQYLISILNLAMAILLIKLRPKDVAARLLVVGMAGTAAVFNLQAHTALTVMPILAGRLHDAFHLISGIAYVYALLLFPDGRMPHWTERRWLASTFRVLYISLFTMAGLILVAGAHGSPQDFVAFFGVLIPAAGVASQSFRHHHAAGAAVRQQSKILLWVLSLTLVAAAILVGVSAAIMGPEASSLRGFVFWVFPPLFALIPITLFVVMIRYKLWEIDRVINRALVYGLISGVLAGVYFLSVAVLGRLAGTLAPGASNDPVLVLSTVVAAALFRPVKTAAQTFVDRRFYRGKYDAAKTLEEFVVRLRRQVDLNAMDGELRAAVWKTLQPGHVSFWLRNSDQSSETSHSPAQRST